MKVQPFILLGLVAGAAYLLSRKATNVAPTIDSIITFSTDPVGAMTDLITSSVAGWKNTGSGSTWVPVLNTAEQAHGIPTDLLARVAYEESHFREDVIRGTKVSPAGALGLMQMEPAYFTSVRVPIPFTDGDVMTQIDEAATQLASLFASTGSWPLALAAYNAGLGNVQKYGGIPPFTETQNYVAQILADVPVSSA